MPFIVTVDYENDLTIFKAEGNPGFEEFLSEIQGFYSGSPTRNVLWVLDQAAVWDITGDDITRLALFPARFGNGREGAKTAIVAPDDLTRALSRLFIHFSENDQPQATVKIFPARVQAEAWLSENA